jgi:hypothetical protein
LALLHYRALLPWLLAAAFVGVALNGLPLLSRLSKTAQHKPFCYQSFT